LYQGAFLILAVFYTGTLYEGGCDGHHVTFTLMFSFLNRTLRLLSTMFKLYISHSVPC